jgi:hypothetical protein
MTTLNIACNKFSPLYTNNSDTKVTLSLSVTSQCGGTTTLGLYDVATNTLESSPVLQPGVNRIDVPGQQLLAVYCESSGHSGGCVADFSVA